jgi:hypothetical protein
MSADVNEHEIWRERAALYALDALASEECAAFEDHLRTCLECGAELLTLRPAVDAMAQAVPLLDPQPELRDRVMAAAFEGARRSSSATVTQTAQPSRVVVKKSSGLRWLGVAAMLFISIGLGVYANALRNRVVRLESELDAAQAQATALQARVGKAETSLASTQTELSSATTQLGVLTAPDSRRVTLAGQPGAPAASGRADWSPSRGLALSVSNLPPLQPMRTYQVWLLTKGNPVSAGLLQTDSSGNRTAVFNPPPGADDPTGVALSEEPAGGVAQPGNRIYLVGKITSAL